MQETRENNKTSRDVISERDYSRARLVDWGGHNQVYIQWNLNDAANQDRVFKLTIGDKTAYINLEELMRYTRWV